LAARPGEGGRSPAEGGRWRTRSAREALMSSQQLRAIRATGKWALVYALGALVLNLVCQTLGTYLLWWADLQKGSSRPRDPISTACCA